MFRTADNTIVLAASDITSYLACGHLFEQRRAIAARERTRPRPVDDPHAALARTRGEGGVAEQPQRPSRELGGHVDLTAPPAYTREGLEAAAARTVDAMRA